jgi:hypothetical protein
MTSHEFGLDAIGLKHGTDKASDRHNYLSLYELYFEKRRNDHLKILEIGVLNGASLAVWEEYFPNAAIVGADIQPAMVRFRRPRVDIEIMDQSSLEDLTAIASRHGPFDIVVEDGSHKWEHQITTLRTIFPHVTEGGIYIVEDLQVAFGEGAEKYRGIASFSCMDYLKRLADYRVAGAHLEEDEDPFLRTYGRNVDFVTFARHCAIIRKGASFWAVSFSEDDIAPRRGGAAAVTLEVGARTAKAGARASQTGALRSLRADSDVQGFWINGEGLGAQDVEYRARMGDGTWSPWVGLGAYVGAKGKGRIMTGFAVRLGDRLRSGHTLECCGLFRGAAAPVAADDGTDCVSPDGALYGLQVYLAKRGG